MNGYGGYDGHSKGDGYDRYDEHDKKKIQWKLLIQYVINAWKCWIPKIYKMCSKLHKSIHYTDA